MAASIIMETLNQIRRELTDQKEYMRNLHDILTEGKITKKIQELTNKNINETYGLLEGKISELHKKIDQQQLTIERLEKHVKKNNLLLFGNDDTDFILEKFNMIEKCEHDEKETKRNDGNLAMVKHSENYNENAEPNQSKNTFMEAGTEEATKNVKDDSDKNDKYQKINNSDNKDEVLTSEDIRGLRKLVKQYVDPIKPSTEEIKLVRKEKVVKISPTFFSEDQISKLNEELDRISKSYQSTDIFPIIKVVPGPYREHSVIKQLRKGVTYQAYDKKTSFSIKLGRDGYKISEVSQLLKEYPDLLLFDVVRQLLISRKLWSDLNQKVDFSRDGPYIYVL